MTSRSSGTQRLEIIVLVLPRPVRELGKELMSIQSGVALSIIQAPMVKGCVGVSKAILSPLPQPPPACQAMLAQAGRQRKRKVQEKACVWQWKRFMQVLQSSAVGVSNTVSPAKGAAAKLSFQIFTSPGPFCRVSLPKANQRAFFTHLAFATTFAWVSVHAMPTSDFYRHIHCTITFTHHGSQTFPSNGFCISSQYWEIQYQKVNVHPLVLFFPPFSLCASTRQPIQ